MGWYSGGGGVQVGGWGVDVMCGTCRGLWVVVKGWWLEEGRAVSD